MNGEFSDIETCYMFFDAPLRSPFCPRLSRNMGAIHVHASTHDEDDDEDNVMIIDGLFLLISLRGGPELHTRSMLRAQKERYRAWDLSVPLV